MGPTASGKTGAAIELALKLGPVLGLPPNEVGGEVISADSRAIYKYMDIGTAKPTLEERKSVPHHGIDLVEPGERYTVADWKAMAEQKIEEIRGRGRVPIIAGGTGLYVDALVFNYQFMGKTGEKAPEGAQCEQKMCSDRQEISPNFAIFGIDWPRNLLKNRQRERLNKLFVQPELFSETEFLANRYGWGSQAMKSDIYQFVWGYLQGKYTLEEAKELNFHDDWHLAKRQLTWFSRNPHISWLPLEKIVPAALDVVRDWTLKNK